MFCNGVWKAEGGRVVEKLHQSLWFLTSEFGRWKGKVQKEKCIRSIEELHRSLWFPTFEFRRMKPKVQKEKGGRAVECFHRTLSFLFLISKVGRAKSGSAKGKSWTLHSVKPCSFDSHVSRSKRRKQKCRKGNVSANMTILVAEWMSRVERLLQ